MSRMIEKAGFYISFGIVNLAVGAAFYAVYVPPPVQAVAPVVTVILRPQVAQKAQPTPAVVGTPVRLVVAAIGVDLDVGVGSYNPVDGSWTLDDQRAFYADESVPANNNNGVTLIYGHARPSVFGRLSEVADAAEAIVYTDSGNVFRYIYTSRQDVAPTDTAILHSEGPPTLVLQTCSGPWDAYRTLLSFRFVSVAQP